MEEHENLSRFERVILPHMDAAYNLARWLTRNEQDAQDVVQEAYLRAFKFFGGYRGGDSRAWLLKIVRNTFYSWAQKNRMEHLSQPFNETVHAVESEEVGPQAVLIQKADSQLVRRAMEELPTEFREALVLRELEGLTYKEIAEVAGVPLGTVMSRLARARKLLQKSLADLMEKES